MTEIMGKLMKITDPECLGKIQKTAFSRKKELNQRNAAVETASWMKNDKVQLLPEHRNRKPWDRVGTITKINPKNIKVDFGNGMFYNVPKTMLMKAE